jgi:hypothetical protein
VLIVADIGWYVEVLGPGEDGLYLPAIMYRQPVISARCPAKVQTDEACLPLAFLRFAGASKQCLLHNVKERMEGLLNGHLGKLTVYDFHSDAVWSNQTQHKHADNCVDVMAMAAALKKHAGELD